MKMKIGKMRKRKKTKIGTKKKIGRMKRKTRSGRASSLFYFLTSSHILFPVIAIYY